MPPDRGRAGKACQACRKQKTRCYAGEKPGGACLRCTTLRTACSFTAEAADESHPFNTPTAANGAGTATDQRLERLESAVTLLLERLGEGEKSDISPTPNRAARQSSPAAGRSRGTSLEEDAVAPVFILRDLAAQSGSSAQGQGQPNQVGAVAYEDVISTGLIGMDDAVLLVSM